MASPGYFKLTATGEIDSRIKQLNELMAECRLCPRECGAKRFEGEVGICEATGELKISSAFPHMGEEPPLTGGFGSGTVFLSHCNLRCVFCQNYDISHMGEGQTVSVDQLAALLIGLQERGCHNINFVTPTHYAPLLVEALAIGARSGLALPVVWNCGGYESIEVIKLLDGIVDIYMPDIKYSDEAPARKYSKAPDYWSVVRDVAMEMHRQVGDLFIDPRGIARFGLLVRHLVMPNGVAGSAAVLKFIAEEISDKTYVNIMTQYRPCYKTAEHEKIDRRPTAKEFEEVYKMARQYGLSLTD